MNYKIRLVPFSFDFLSLSFNWLNDKEIRELTNNRSFTVEEQLTWYKGLKNKKKYYIRGIQAGTKKIGVCGLKKITKSDCEYWGYIGEKEFWGKGIGSIIVIEMENKAREMGLKSIWLQVLQSNMRAINLYNKMKFTQGERKGKLVYMRKEL